MNAAWFGCGMASIWARIFRSDMKGMARMKMVHTEKENMWQEVSYRLNGLKIHDVKLYMKMDLFFLLRF